MSDFLLNVVIIFAELGAVLFLALVFGIVYLLIRAKKEEKNTRDLIEYIKDFFSLHRTQLTSYFEKQVENGKVAVNVSVLLNHEKSFYEKIVKVSIDKDTLLLKAMVDDMHGLINDYVRVLTAEVETENDTNKSSRDVMLKKENEALRLENESLEKRLAASTMTIESMLGEFSSMYEGGKKEGEQRVKNEMYLLKQTLKDEEVEVKSKVADIDTEKVSDKEK